MSYSDAEAWLRLTLPAGLGGASTLKLLRALGSPQQVLAASPAALTPLLSARQREALKAGPDPALLANTLAWLETEGNALITLADSAYPPRLLEISDPPPLLYVKGQSALLRHPAIAIVGSRNATTQGMANAEAFARELSAKDWCIVSGLAQGIDAAAHRGGLTGMGRSIAVVGTGLDIVFPAANHALAHALAANGCLVSEFPLGTPARPGHFPRRNRIISGLARGVLVVEAAPQSGSLITAREAAEQGREVFAIPGSIHSPLARGCHQLIRQGAKLVETAADILEELDTSPPDKAPAPWVPPPTTPALPENSAQAALLAAMGHDPVDVETLCGRCSLTVEQAYEMLLTLELEGHISRLPGGQYQQLAGIQP